MYSRQQLLTWTFRRLGDIYYVYYFLSNQLSSGYLKIASLLGYSSQHFSGRWGLLPSLYSALTGRQVCFVELSAMLRYSGDYITPQLIFEHLLPPTNSLPVLALERATLYEMEGLDAMAATCLKEAMEVYQNKEWDASSSLFRLMKIRRASTEMTAYGHLPQALDEARKLYSWLENQDLNDYTDVTVLISSYAILCSFSARC